MLFFDHAQNDICAFLNAQSAAAEAHIVILCGTPGSAGVMMVIHSAALILFQQACFWTLLGFAVQLYNAVSPELGAGMDECMQAIRTVLENVVCVSTDDYTGTFFCQLQDYAALHIPKEICSGETVENAWDALMCEGIGKNAVAGSVFAVFLYKVGSKAGFQCNMFHKLLVVEGNTELLSYQMTDRAATAAKFTADCDDLLSHNNPSFRI